MIWCCVHQEILSLYSLNRGSNVFFKARYIQNKYAMYLSIPNPISFWILILKDIICILYVTKWGLVICEKVPSLNILKFTYYNCFTQMFIYFQIKTYLLNYMKWFVFQFVHHFIYKRNKYVIVNMSLWMMFIIGQGDWHHLDSISRYNT